MSQRGGKRAGAGRPRGSQEPKTIVRETVKQAVIQATAARVIEELALIGFSDIGDYVDDNGSFLPMSAIAPGARRVLASLKTSKYNRPGAKDGVQEDALEIRLWSKMEALVTLARYHGLLVDKLKVEDDRPLRARIDAARQRLHKATKGRSRSAEPVDTESDVD